METCLVAGGAGFIGSHLCGSLLSDGYKVICVDNLLTGVKNNLNSFASNPNFQFIQADITKDNLQIEKVDYVFHLASPASPNAKSDKSYLAYPVETLLVNSLGTYNLLELCKKNNAKFFYTSSSEIYGDPKESPQKEEYFGNVSPNGPRSVYDEGKRFGEAITMAYFRKFGLDVRVARVFNTYGPKMRKDDGRVVSNFIVQAISNTPITIYGKGDQTRSFCYVKDMIIAFKNAMFMQNTKGQVFNLGNPDERKISELAEIIKKMTGSSSAIIYQDLPIDDPRERKPDISKAKLVLNWEPKIDLETGLLETIEYFNSLL